ncbi:MAG: hypothetical protein ACOYLS_00920 [Polymorphobacter sp.]
MTARSLKTAIALLASTLAFAAATAQPAPVDPLANNAAALAPAGDTASQIAFAYADRNADTVVSWEEYRNRGVRLFARVDTNEDGILQIAELQALAGPSAPTAPFDVKIETFNAALRKYFDMGDKDSNGALTPTEWHDTVRPSKLF